MSKKSASSKQTKGDTTGTDEKAEEQKNLGNASGSPSALTSVLVIAFVMVVSVASATAAAAILRDLLTSVAVFIFTLLVLTIVVPYLLLATGTLSEARWFKTYVLVLKRNAGIDE